MNMQIRRMTVALLAVLVLAATGFTTCSRFSSASLKLPANPILSGGLGWAVVKNAYVRLKEGPSDSTKDLDHLRRGSVFRLDARAFSSRDAGTSVAKADEREIWYGVSTDSTKGWVRESELDVFRSQEQAEKAATVYR